MIKEGKSGTEPWPISGILVGSSSVKMEQNCLFRDSALSFALEMVCAATFTEEIPKTFCLLVLNKIPEWLSIFRMYAGSYDIFYVSLVLFLDLSVGASSQ